MLGNGNGTFQTPTKFTKPGFPNGLVAATLANGHPGFAVADNSSSNVYVYYGNGAGGFLTPELVPSMSSIGLAFGDLNGDGILDLVNSSGYIAFGATGGKFKRAVQYTVVDFENNFFNVVLADFTEQRPHGHTDG